MIKKTVEAIKKHIKWAFTHVPAASWNPIYGYRRFGWKEHSPRNIKVSPNAETSYFCCWQGNGHRSPLQRNSIRDTVIWLREEGFPDAQSAFPPKHGGKTFPGEKGVSGSYGVAWSEDYRYNSSYYRRVILPDLLLYVIRRFLCYEKISEERRDRIADLFNLSDLRSCCLEQITEPAR